MDKYRWQFDVVHHAAWRFLAARNETLKAAYLQNRLQQSERQDAGERKMQEGSKRRSIMHDLSLIHI